MAYKRKYRKTEDAFSPAHESVMNKTITHVKDTMHGEIMYHKLSMTILSLVAISDAYFALDMDISSQNWNIIMLADNYNRANIISFSSYTSKRVVRFVLGCETYVFSDCFDSSYALKDELSRMLGRRIPMLMPTDSDLLFNIIVRSSTTTKKRLLMIDLVDTREA